MSERYSSLLKEKLDGKEEKQAAHFRNFKVAKERLQKSSRNKRSVSLAPTLNQEQRVALGKMHNLYHGLKDASKDFALRFRSEISDLEMPVALAQTAGVSQKDITQILSRIRWEHSSIRAQKVSGSTNFYKKDSWGDWDENPFNTFYDNNERAFHSDIEKLQANAREVNNRKQLLDRIGAQFVSQYEGTTRGNQLKQQLWKRKKEVALLSAAKDSHIVERVANYLLKSMGQLNS